jgi:hypothetical protein
MSDQPNLKNSSPIDFERLKQELHESDFDGHTEFHNMTFTQKLTWLSEVVQTTYLLAKSNPKAACNSFFKKNK